MNKVFATAAIALALGAGAVSAQTTTTIQRPAVTSIQPGAATGSYRVAQLRSQHAFGVHTTSALSRNVGPGSTVNGLSDTPLDSPNSGMPLVAGAPGAGNVAGGN